MRPDLRTALTVLALAGLAGVAAVTTPPAPEPPVPGFSVFHYRSDLAEGRPGLREVFLVEALDPGFQARSADVELREDGVARPVDWVDDDGWVSVDDRFSFVDEPFDKQRMLTAHVQGAQVMECRFAGGAGMGFTPDEWRAMGQPEIVACLPELDVDGHPLDHAHGVDDEPHGHA